MITSMEKKRKLETVRYTIKSEKLPRKMRPLKLVMLADLHDRLWGEHQRFLADKIEKLQTAWKGQKIPSEMQPIHREKRQASPIARRQPLFLSAKGLTFDGTAMLPLLLAEKRED